MKAEIRAHAFIRIDLGLDEAAKLQKHLDDTLTPDSDGDLVEILDSLNEFVPEVGPG